MFLLSSRCRIQTRPLHLILLPHKLTKPTRHHKSTMSTPSVPRPSASILLLSPTNDVLLLHRVITSSSFPAAHVFPGGNLDTFHDGEIPTPEADERHRDGAAYRMAAVRECFEETGILLAKKSGEKGLLDVGREERERARKTVYKKEEKFADWVAKQGGIPDTEGLMPFTRWVTPTNMPKRFTTQMYLYLLPLSSSSSSSSSSLITATPDNGVEHTAADFASPHEFLEQARKGEIILFPPQCYLLSLLAQFIPSPSSASGPSADATNYAKQRQDILRFLQTTPTATAADGSPSQHPTASIPWADKVMSPRSLFIRASDRRGVLGIDHPGPELKDSDRAGDWDRVVLARFTKAGPVEVEVRGREEMFEEERAHKAAREGKL